MVTEGRIRTLSLDGLNIQAYRQIANTPLEEITKDQISEVLKTELQLKQQAEHDKWSFYVHSINYGFPRTFEFAEDNFIYVGLIQAALPMDGFFSFLVAKHFFEENNKVFARELEVKTPKFSRTIAFGMNLDYNQRRQIDEWIELDHLRDKVKGTYNAIGATQRMIRDCLSF